MKRTITTISLAALLFGFVAPTLVHAQIGSVRDAIEDEVQENVNEETLEAIENKVDEVQDATFDTRQAFVVDALTLAIDRLDDALDNVDSAQYASKTTKDDCSTTIKGAQAELEGVLSSAKEATDTDTLVAAREDAVNALAKNKQVAKDCVVSAYIDGLKAANQSVEESILLGKSVVVYYTYYGLDTTTLEAAITTAEASLEDAEGDAGSAEEARTQDSLDTATRSSIDAAEDAVEMYEEIDALYSEYEEAVESSDEDAA